METVSVIIPTWNRAISLQRAVRSVLNQTYPVKEIFICDDGSTDDSRNVIMEMKESRITWLDCGRNGRPAIPRNMGIQKSSGDWLAFLDDDDEWLPGKTGEEIIFATKKKCKAVSSNANRISKEKITSLFFQSHY